MPDLLQGFMKTWLQASSKWQQHKILNLLHNMVPVTYCCHQSAPQSPLVVIHWSCFVTAQNECKYNWLFIIIMFITLCLKLQKDKLQYITAQWPTLLLHIWEIPSTNLGQKVNYPDHSFVTFFSPPRQMPQSLPSMSLTIYNSLPHQNHRTVSFFSNTAINKHQTKTRTHNCFRIKN